jgi:hypothetical protein
MSRENVETDAKPMSSLTMAATRLLGLAIALIFGVAGFALADDFAGTPQSDTIRGTEGGDFIDGLVAALI